MSKDDDLTELGSLDLFADLSVDDGAMGCSFLM